MLVAGFARRLLLGRHIAAVRDAAADDDGVVVVEIPAGPHLADVRPERALVVLVDGVEVEVVRPVVLAFAFLVVVRAHINGGSWRWGSLISKDTGRQAGMQRRGGRKHTVLPSAHEICGQLLLRVTLGACGERRFVGIVF